MKTEPDPLPALAMARSALTLLYAAVLGNDLGELPHPRPTKLLDQLRLVLRVRHYSREPKSVTSTGPGGSFSFTTNATLARWEPPKST